MRLDTRAPLLEGALVSICELVRADLTCSIFVALVEVVSEGIRANFVPVT